LVWEEKPFAVLVLLEVSSANVVVVTIEFPATETPVKDKSTIRAQLLRHISPQERSYRGLALA
jgi:hypothetical protein